MALYIGGVAVDATAAEIDVLDGLDRGSIIYGNASSATTVLDQGTADQVLTSDGTDIAWAAAAGGKLVKVGTHELANDSGVSNTTDWATIYTAAYDPDGGSNNTTTIYGYLAAKVATVNSEGRENRSYGKYDITGDDITNETDIGAPHIWFGNYDYADAAYLLLYQHIVWHFYPVTLDGTGSATITYTIKVKPVSTDVAISMGGGNDPAVNAGLGGTNCFFWEVES